MRDLTIQFLNCRLILNNSILINIQTISEKLKDIKLSRYGEDLELELQECFPDSKEVIKFGIIKDGYSEDFHVEISEENVNNLKQSISELLISKDILLPWVYGKELYDYYFENFETQEKQLDFQDTEKLIKGSSSGVFQIDNTIISSLGLVDSKNFRSIYPKLNMNLYHCSDPSCPHFHKVSFTAFEDAELTAISEYLEALDSDKEIIDLDELQPEIDDKTYYNEYNTESLPQLIFDSFNIEELKLALINLLDNYKLRERIPHLLNKGSNDWIVKNLDKSQIISLILIEDDEVIIESIEELIDKKILNINSTEVRMPNEPEYFGTHMTYLEFNNLGFRSKCTDLTSSIKKLKNLIKKIYSETQYVEQLEWRLRNITFSQSLEDKLNYYLENYSPREVVSNLVFSGPVQLRSTFEILPGHFILPSNQIEEEYVINKIVWKLGFNVISNSKNLNEIWRHIETFKSEVNSTKIYHENDKEKIRSSGVNVFVALEEKLQESLCFINWVLLSDHYLDTNFVYNYTKSKSLMYNTLNNYEYSAGETLVLDENGKNTLFPLIQGFNCLSKICKEIINHKPDYERPSNEFPSFYCKNPLLEFQFKYKPLFLNLHLNDFEKITKSLEQITSEFNRGNVLSIRNRLQHSREDFPIQDEILKSISSIEIVLTIIEENTFYPTTFRKIKTEIDEFDRTKFTLQNYKSKLHTFYDYSEVGGSKIPLPGNHNIIFENVYLGNTKYPLLFVYTEESYYQNYWSNYPRKKLKEISE
ncbi:hypothetical protein [Chryseobacterium sp. NKUCC03_KSP]|uniref:hypothetical protein n=1 Tax=Chryseobacterium sp. NKUCC03_KSP TaxID=2842125 RepID=UPI001C5B8B1A|nr:hypothetical protein [Chryseobacterium sp. NKUCC03_KSP]MBW3524948.1 hypothetical protein [Chryseobacterium sp. NKUCC03_KSP]